MCECGGGDEGISCSGAGGDAGGKGCKGGDITNLTTAADFVTLILPLLLLLLCASFGVSASHLDGRTSRMGIKQ